MLAWPV